MKNEFLDGMGEVILIKIDRDFGDDELRLLRKEYIENSLFKTKKINVILGYSQKLLNVFNTFDSLAYLRAHENHFNILLTLK